MSADWVHANFKAIFPTEFPANCLAALDGLAYAPSMKPLFQELGRYFWMVRGEPLTAEQKERIFLFWDRCVTWGKTLDPAPASLLSQLSLLSCYLTAIDERALRWLVAIAPFTPVNYNADRLIEQLARLADTSSGAAAHVLRVLLKAYQPSYDFEDRLKMLIVQLAAHAESRSDAILGVASAAP